jgi:hypothetical protein
LDFFRFLWGIANLASEKKDSDMIPTGQRWQDISPDPNAPRSDRHASSGYCQGAFWGLDP